MPISTVQCQRRRQPGDHHHHARRPRQRPPVPQRPRSHIDLYDASGNLVATATGNAPDGINSIIDYVATTPGNYVLPIDGSSKTNLGEYTISITGDTGGLNPFQGHLDQPGRRLRPRLPGLDPDRNVQRQRAPIEYQRQRFHDRRQRSHRRDVDEQQHGESSPSRRPRTASITSSISGVEDLQGTVAPTDSFTFETDDVPPVRGVQLDRRWGGAVAGSADRSHHVQQADSALVGQ